MNHQTTQESKKRFRIGDLANELKVKKFVVRFWEKEFDLHLSRSEGGQRCYTEADLAIFRQIKDLLYVQGYTIAGARQQLLHAKEAPAAVPPIEHSITPAVAAALDEHQQIDSSEQTIVPAHMDIQNSTHQPATSRKPDARRLQRLGELRTRLETLKRRLEETDVL